MDLGLLIQAVRKLGVGGTQQLRELKELRSSEGQHCCPSVRRERRKGREEKKEQSIRTADGK